MHPRAFATVVLCAATILPLRLAAQQAQTAAQPGSTALTTEQQALFDSARADFQASRFSDALPKLQQLHQQLPANAFIAKFAAEAAVNTGDFASASSLLHTVLGTSPEDPQALAIQAHLYGQQHDTASRDALLDRLQKLHDSGKISLQSVIVEKDALPAGGSVNIIDFLQPWSRFHIALMAEFFDNTGHRTERIALESDDIDQVNFSRQHPEQASAGVRIYTMDSYSEKYGPDGKPTSEVHGTLCPVPGCFITGKPTYEFFREFVLKKQAAAPISTTSTPASSAH